MKYFVQQKLKKTEGYTLIEVFIVSILSAMIVYGLMHLSTSVGSNVKKFENLFVQTYDTVSAERLILSDFRNAYLSFNNINLNLAGSRQFFDLFLDTPSQSLSQQDLTRTIELGLDKSKGQVREFVFIVSKSSPGLYDPVRAYHVDYPAQASQAATLTYKGIDNLDYVSNSGFGLLPEYWNNGATFMVYTPASFREGDLNHSKPGRWPFFIGYVNDNDLTDIDIVVNGNHAIRKEHPLDAGIKINSAEKFFDTLPAVGGAAVPHVFIVAIDLVKYEVVTRTAADGEKILQLFRKRFINGAWENKGQLISEDFERVQLHRRSVMIPSISVEIKRKNHT